MSQPSLADQVASDLRSLQSEVSSLHTRVRLSSLRDQVGNLETTATGLPQAVRDLRTAGYVFEKDLEERAADLAQRWARLSPQVSQQIEQQSLILQMGMRPIEEQMQNVVAYVSDPSMAQPRINSARAAVEAYGGKVAAAERSISGIFDQLQTEFNTFTAHLKQLQWALAQASEATFPWLQGEGLINAVQAAWVQKEKGTKDDPKGVLFLTDGRLVFEQKQDVATKKVLFVTTQKTRVQKLLFEVPLTDVENATASDQGFLGHEDHVFVKVAHAGERHLHIDGQDCKLWQGQITRAKGREFDRQRVGASAEAEAPLKAAPDKCPNCGGKITAKVLRGMDSITCEYCGSVIRL
jgi:hypothetical protein